MREHDQPEPARSDQSPTRQDNNEGSLDGQVKVGVNPVLVGPIVSQSSHINKPFSTVVENGVHDLTLEQAGDLVARLRECPVCGGDGTFGDSPCPRCAISIKQQAADLIERQDARLKEADGLFREWLSTELDSMDEEFEPWITQFTNRIKEWLNDH